MLQLFRLRDKATVDAAPHTVLCALGASLPTAPKINATVVVDRSAMLLPHTAALIVEIALAIAASGAETSVARPS
jgi:hypothetical protein